VAQRHSEWLRTAQLKSDSYDGLDPFGHFGHPRALYATRAINPEESAVMWPGSSFVLHSKMEKAVPTATQRIKQKYSQENH